MYNYIPERIYKVIKDDKDFIEISKMIETEKEKSICLEDIIKSDKEILLKYGNKLDTLRNIIKNKCPEYYTQYIINSSDVKKEDLLNYYNNINLDKETKLFILSELIEVSWDDRTYENYMTTYNQLYETLTSEELNKVSSYVHFKYLYGVPFIESRRKLLSNTYLADMIELIKRVYTKIDKYDINKDSLKHCYIETVSNIFPIMCDRFNDDKAVYNQLHTDLGIEQLEFQYDDISYHKLRIYDNIFTISFHAREFRRAFYNFRNIVKYLDYCLKDKTKLYRALNFYDKCNHAKFVILIRKYLKLMEIFPDFGFELENLSDIDREFALNNEFEESKAPNTAYVGIASRYKKHVDDWVEGNEPTYEIFKTLPIYFYLLIELNPDKYKQEKDTRYED